MGAPRKIGIRSNQLRILAGNIACYGSSIFLYSSGKTGMGTSVLQSRGQIAEARTQLSVRGVGWKRNKLRDVLSRLRLLPPQANIGDELKSWDVLKTAQFATDNLRLTDPVLDIGAFASEILIVLHRAGFSNLTGVDLNPRSAPCPMRARFDTR
jgi:hypothetical protein